MNVMVVYNPSEDRVNIDSKRFTALTENLRLVGLRAASYQVKTIQQFEDLVMKEKPDIVYSAAYYLQGKSSDQESVQSLLESLHLPYIGSDVQSLERVLSKSTLKEVWNVNNVSTPPFCTVRRNNWKVELLNEFFTSTDFPYILKPDKEGNSRGLDESSIVFDQESLRAKIDTMVKTYEKILVEKYLGDAADVREFTVAMIGEGNHMLLMPAEVVLKKKKIHRIITTVDKDLHGTLSIPVTESRLHDALCDLAKRAYTVAAVRDYSRFDVLLANGKLYAIEINGLPMIPDKWFETCAAGVGLSSTQYLTAIFLAGIVRNIRSGKLNSPLPLRMIQSVPQKFVKLFCETN